MTNQPLTDILQQRLRFARRSEPAHAAVLIAITKDAADPKVLLTRRAQHMNNHAGEVAFPGGKRDDSDQSDIGVALREAFEETALQPEEVEIIGDLPMQRSKAGLLVKPIVGLISPSLQLVPQPTEIDRIFYASLHQLMHAEPIPYEVLHHQQALYFPSMQVENEIVWGLTARMLINLFKYGLGYQKDWPMFLNSPLVETAR